MDIVSDYTNTSREIAFIVGACAFLTALAIGVLLTSLWCRLSWRFGALDRPDGQLKCHRRATPTLGGLPLFAALLIGVVVSFAPTRNLWYAGAYPPAWNVQLGSLLVGSLVILAVGISDDLRGIMPRTKLLFQMLSAVVLVGGGLIVRRVDFFGVFEIPLGVLGVPFTLFWLIGSCNAFNFIDGMDGLASGIGTVIAMVLAVLGFFTGAYGAAVVSLALAGSLLSVLLFNIKPAMIFLGDSGSQLLGLIVGVLAIRIAGMNGTFALPAVGVILSVPVLDALLSILRRWSASMSPAKGDHHHIHHCLARCGLSVRQVSAVLCAVTVLTGLMGIACWLGMGVPMGFAALAFVCLELYLGLRLGCLDIRQFSQRVAVVMKLREPAFDIAAEKSKSNLELLWDRMKPVFEQMELDRAVLTLQATDDTGRKNHEIYQWVRSDELIADLLSRKWSKRFSLGDDDDNQVAILRLESADPPRSESERIDWVLREITNNMRLVSQKSTQPTPQQEEAEEFAEVG